MAARIDMTGMRFGRLTVIRRAPKPEGIKATGAFWECLCDCGNTTVVYGHNLRKGTTLSCGCYRRDNARAVHTTHGMKGTSLYQKWKKMRIRCHNEKDERYADYGGRGITVCMEWDEDFMNFYNWAMSHGYRKGLTIGRVDVNRGYCPENCKWVPLEEQAWNKRNSRNLTIDGVTRCVGEWSKISGIRVGTIYKRIKLGWSDYDAVFEPLHEVTDKRRHK